MAAALAVVALVRLVREQRRAAVWLAASLALSGVVYLVAHRLLWGGWTVYATGDHFVQTGEFSVIGVEPDYVGRSLRLVALLSDQAYGLVAWQPAWLLAVPAVGALVALRGRATPGFVRAAALAPLLAGWTVATWWALTMHGFWWPGRQVVAVLPIAALVVLWWVGRIVPWLKPVAAALGLIGVAHYAAMLVDGWAGHVTWVASFDGVQDPLYQILRPVFPDYRERGARFLAAPPCLDRHHPGFAVARRALGASLGQNPPLVDRLKGSLCHDSVPEDSDLPDRRRLRRTRTRSGRLCRRRCRTPAPQWFRLGFGLGFWLGRRGRRDRSHAQRDAARRPR